MRKPSSCVSTGHNSPDKETGNQIVTVFASNYSIFYEANQQEKEEDLANRKDAETLRLFEGGHQSPSIIPRIVMV